MRVAHLACVAPPEIGGIGRVAAEEVHYLRADGIDAILFAPEGSENIPNEPAIRRLHPYWRLRNAASLPMKPVFDWKPDVVHLHYPFYGTAELWLCRVLRVPVVVTFHMDAMPTGWRKHITTIHQRWVQPFFLRHASAIIISSRDYVERSSLKPSLAELDSKIEEIPFSVDTTEFVPIPHECTSTVQLLFVGGMDAAHAFKGVPELLRALEGLKEASWHLTLVGDGSLRAAYEEEARIRGLAERLTFRGRIPQSDLAAAYQQADILLFPSTTAAEAFGLVALEAQSCGVPVIASDLPGVRTVVRHEETGLLVPPGDVGALRQTIKRLLEDAPLRERFGSTARTRVVATYSWSVHIEALKKIYERVCASRS